MARCKDCIHENVCLHRANIQTDTYAYMGVKYGTEKCEHFTPTADVVPKSEVERLQKAYDEYEETSGLKQAKKDIVSKILDELKEYIPPQKIGLFNSIYIADVIYELKKKYTEGET